MAEELPVGGFHKIQLDKSKDAEFSLTEDEMQKINYLGKLERRKYKSKMPRDGKRSAFSENMSIEAQIAMQLAFRDTQAMKSKGQIDSEDENGSPQKNKGSPPKHNHVKFADEPPERPDTTCSKYSTYSEAYEKIGSVRMVCDLTDERFQPLEARKRALDGMKVTNTLEMVELVNREDPNCPDDDVIDQIAQRNAVEKCLVWMEVLGPDGTPDTDKKSDTPSEKETTNKPLRGKAIPME